MSIAEIPSSGSSSSGENDSPITTPSSTSVVGEDTYPALSFPGPAELPLDEQLEPIAVVGMGEHTSSAPIP
jgi:hypothetical protein